MSEKCGAGKGNIMPEYKTEFGSLDNYNKGGVQVIEDDPKNYVFSNVYEVAKNAAPFERIAVAKNFEYVVEAMRVEAVSPWFTAPHDEFALCMDGDIEVQLVKLAEAAPNGGGDGATQLKGEAEGQKMGRIKAGKGHMAMLPAGAAYRFQSEKPAVVMIQTIQGELTLERWNEICQTA